MHPVTHWLPPSAGFSVLELMVVIALMSIGLAIGLPAMSGWMQASRAAAATEFYADGLRRARELAISNNAASRFRLTENASNGQLDWQVDLCFPTPATPCNDESGNWSTTADGASGDPLGSVAATRSILRSAQALPKVDVLVLTLTPAGATDIYFTSVGWVNTAVGNRLTRIVLSPGVAYAGEFPTAAIAVTLSGNANRCNPNVDAADSRACPP